MVGMARCHWQAASLHGKRLGQPQPHAAQARVIAEETLTRVEAEHQVRRRR